MLLKLHCSNVAEENPEILGGGTLGIHKSYI